MTTCGAFPRQQRRAVELHDSKVISARAAGGSVEILLSAYVHVSSGVPGQAAGTGWEQEVLLVLREGALLEAPEGSLWIQAGAVSVGGQAEELLALPFARDGEVRVELSGVEGRLLATGHGVRLEEHGEPRFIERTAFE